MKVKEKAAFLSELWLHVNAGNEGMQVGHLMGFGELLTKEISY